MGLPNPGIRQSDNYRFNPRIIFCVERKDRAFKLGEIPSNKCNQTYWHCQIKIIPCCYHFPTSLCLHIMGVITSQGIDAHHTVHLRKPKLSHVCPKPLELGSLKTLLAVWTHCLHICPHILEWKMSVGKLGRALHAYPTTKP